VFAHLLADGARAIIRPYFRKPVAVTDKGWSGFYDPVTDADKKAEQFFIAAADTYHQAFIPWALQVTAMSVAMAWLYARTRGSLLLVMLLHAAVNNTKDIVPSALPGATNTFALAASPILWLTAGLLWVVAACLLTRMRGRRID